MDERTQPGNRRARAEARRAQIVAVAAELFARNGYRGTGLAEVAARVGISLPGVLHHFGTKEGLLQAVIEQRDADSEFFVMEQLGGTGADALRDLPTAARHVARLPELAKLFAVLVAENLEPGAPAHDHFVRRYRAIRALVASRIRRSQRAGETRPDVDPEQKAAEIIATLDGLNTQWLLDPESMDIVAAVESYAATLDRDLHLHPATGTG